MHCVEQFVSTLRCFPAGYVTKCLLSPDMQKLATVSSDKTVKLWNIDGFTLDRTLTGMPCVVDC